MKFHIHSIPSVGVESRWPGVGVVVSEVGSKSAGSSRSAGDGDVAPGCGGERDEAGQLGTVALAQGQAANAAGSEFVERERPETGHQIA
jgi:hypothetical protein